MSICDCNQGRLPCTCKTQLTGEYHADLNAAQSELTALREDFDRVTAERDALEAVLRELLSGTGSSPGANKKYGKARAVLDGLRKKADSLICSPANPHNYHLGECTKCGAISPTE